MAAHAKGVGALLFQAAKEADTETEAEEAQAAAAAVRN